MLGICAGGAGEPAFLPRLHFPLNTYKADNGGVYEFMLFLEEMRLWVVLLIFGVFNVFNKFIFGVYF